MAPAGMPTRAHKPGSTPPLLLVVLLLPAATEEPPPTLDPVEMAALLPAEDAREDTCADEVDPPMLLGPLASTLLLPPLLLLDEVDGPSGCAVGTHPTNNTPRKQS